MIQLPGLGKLLTALGSFHLSPLPDLDFPTFRQLGR